MNRRQYSKWRSKIAKDFKKHGVRIQVKTLTKLQTRINNAIRGLNDRKNKVCSWSFYDAADIVVEAIGLPCIYCGTIIKWNTWSLDHKKPVARGGTNSTQNIQVICKGCNRGKADVSHIVYKSFLKWTDKWPLYRTGLRARMRFGGSYHAV